MGDSVATSSPEPIAIVGIGCRFPGDSSTPSKLWDLLRDGRSAHSKMPKNRFDIDKWHHPDLDRPGSIPSVGGYFLGHDESFRQFDPSFFGISPLEAASMDPQQMKFLEVVYESFESAGAKLEDLSGSKTSCYVGCFTRDVANGDLHEFEYGAPYQMTGSGLTILSNRVNYVFNLKGPSMTIDTACSSSMYALHAACQSLQLGDSDAAIVGGTNLMLGVEQHIATVRLGVFSPTSTCHTFDESADGFGRGEGICAFYLKTLSKAIADSDPVRAVIRATAINANGRSQGINHPSVDGQEAVIRAAYTRAGLHFNETPFFECHGTGTQVGDGVEVAAVANVFADGRTSATPLLLGSVKTNIGHTEGTSGIASVLKAVLSIENDMIPATVGVRKLNPAVDFKNGRLEVVRCTRPWPSGLPKRASINSFGYGGANAHCIVEAPEILLGNIAANQRPINLGVASAGTNGHKHNEPLPPREKRHLLVFSAHDRTTLDKNIQALADAAHNYHASDIAYTLACRRTRHLHRAFAILANNEGDFNFTTQSIQHASQLGHRKPRVAFAYTGQGAQWAQMGHGLAQEYSIVRDALELMQTALDRLPNQPSWTLLGELSKKADQSRVQEAELSQPLCIAVQVAITVLLKSWGILPQAVVGHSSGEVPAAFAAGLLTAEEAVVIAFYRGIAHVACHEDGAMMAVGLGAAEVQPYLDSEPDITIACENSPQSVTLSGGSDAIDRAQVVIAGDGLFARKINTSNNAYHSPRVWKAGQYYEERFGASLAHIKASPRDCKAPMYSCITGKVLRSEQDVGIDYWRHNMEDRVRFTQAVSNLVENEPDVNCLLEIGPHSALSGPLRQIRASLDLNAEKMDYIPTLIRGEDGVENLLKTAGKLFCAGYPIDIATVNSGGSREGKFIPNLPTYQWNYNELPRTENRQTRQIRYRKHPRHDLLGSRQLANSDFSPEWRNRLKIKDVPWIADHQIGDDVLFPAAGYVAMAIEAVTQIAENQAMAVQGYSFERLFIKTPLIIPLDGEVEAFFNLHSLSDTSAAKKRFNFSVNTVTTQDKWVEHAVGSIAIDNQDETRLDHSLEVKGYRGAENTESSDRRWYSAMSKLGLRYGTSFRPLRDIRTTAEVRSAMAHINLRPAEGTMVQESRYVIHPATLDGCLQLAMIASQGDVTQAMKAYLPTVIESLKIWPTSGSAVLSKEGIVKGSGLRKGMRSAHGKSELYTTDGRQLCELSVSLYSVEGLTGSSNEDTQRPYSRLIWKPDIERLSENYLRRIFTSPVDQDTSSMAAVLSEIPAAYIKTASVLDLIAHKEPRLRVLEICRDVRRATETVFSALQALSSSSCFVQYTIATTTDESASFISNALKGTTNVDFRVFDTSQDLASQEWLAESYDILVATHYVQWSTGLLGEFQNLLKPSDWLSKAVQKLDDSIGDACKNKIIVAPAETESPTSISSREGLWVVYRRTCDKLVDAITACAQSHGIETQSISLTMLESQLPHGARVLMAAEAEGPFLSTMTRDEMASTKTLFKRANSVVWVTNSGLRAGKRPKSSLIYGVAKPIMAAQPSISISNVDIDLDNCDLVATSDVIVKHELALREDSGNLVETELVIEDGIPHICRYVLDDVENQQFTRQTHPAPEGHILAENLDLAFRQVGRVDSFYFKNKGPAVEIKEGDVVLRPLYYSLSSREAAVLKGQLDAETFSSVCIASVDGATDNTVQSKPAQRVVCLRPGNFDTSFTTSATNYEVLRKEDSEKDLVSSLLPYCTAMHALSIVGRAQKGQTVLIHRFSGPNEIAAFRYARILGAKVVTTFESVEKRDFFHVAYPELESCVSIIADSGLISKLSSLNSKIDVAVILSDAPDLPEVWKCLAKNGKLVCERGSELPNISLLDPAVFTRGVSLTTFDIHDMIKTETEEVGKLVRKVILLMRDGILAPVSPTATFNISDLPAAVAAVSDPANTSNVVLEYNADSIIPTHTLHEPIAFPPTASYLLVGCLGGLGRSLVMWMLRRGARHFLFLSRSGAEKPEAAALVKELEEAAAAKGATVSITIVRGDVANRPDVERAISLAKSRIHGVIQAAAYWKDGLFDDLKLEDWQMALRPKVQGTINLHEALLHGELDFFVMTSSTIGITGAATQSGYAASNAFLDNFARHRHSLGLSACSLSLGMVVEVGHVEANPEIHDALRRRGIYGITEDEYLRMMEVACRITRNSDRICFKLDPAVQSHIVTGMEPGKVSLNSPWLNDSRFRHIAVAVSGSQQTYTSSSSNSATNQTAAVLQAAEQAGGEAAVRDAIQELLVQQMAKLVLVPVEKLEESLMLSLADLGLNDSMFVAGLKSWAWKELKADIPFIKILEGSLTISELGGLLWEKMDSAAWRPI